uniref:Adaptor related protein complex 1 subunit mu 1 n=1 Tax=Spermophilus dauricus TaxID=99837 RepID=A0A8C9PJD8_SPEDA
MSAVKAPVCPLPPRPQVLICRNYRGDVDMSEVEHFMPILMEKEEEGMLSPILAHGGVRFMWIKHNNLYLVATSKKNACVSLVFSFLYKVVQVFSEYFKELEEESIRDNFVIIYELLDELMDFGYPQTTDSKILQEYITQEGHKLETGAPRPPATVTNAVSWRSEGIKYRKNEVFLDVIESVNLLVSANGNVLRSEIVGSIKMRVFLSGMPELRLGLNDKVLFDNTGRGKSKSVELEDVKFHQCVRLSRFENDRTISFIPPDGEFELMSYRLNTHVKPLIWIESVIEKHSHSRIEYMIKAKSQFKRRSTANNVEIHIPVPNDADSPKFKTTVGSVKWVPENSEIVWSIKSFPSLPLLQEVRKARVALVLLKVLGDTSSLSIAAPPLWMQGPSYSLEVRSGNRKGPSWPSSSLKMVLPSAPSFCVCSYLLGSPVTVPHCRPLRCS